MREAVAGDEERDCEIIERIGQRHEESGENARFDERQDDLRQHIPLRWRPDRAQHRSASGSSPVSFGSTISTTIGTLKAMCEISTDAKPRLHADDREQDQEEAPMMTSGLTISTLFSDSSVFCAAADSRVEWIAERADRRRGSSQMSGREQGDEHRVEHDDDQPRVLRTLPRNNPA